MSGFVFFDTETTGLSTAFDQILQFGAIRTDSDFNVLERFDMRCRLMPHITPSPTALLIASVTPEKLTDASLPSHYEMMQAVYQKLEEWSPAVFIGWNSLKFDEELLRQSFYQTLHFPYLTNTQQSCRADALRIARTISLLEPGSLKVPTNDEGRPSFRLQDVAAANGFKSHQAHDAMGDAEATLFLCQKMEQQAPDIWSHTMRFSQKAAARSFIEEEKTFAFVQSGFSNVEPKLVVLIGASSRDKNALYAFDLAYDPNNIRRLSIADMRHMLGWPHTAVLPVKVNASPMMLYPEDVPDNLYTHELSPQQIERRLKDIQRDQELCAQIVSVMEENALPGGGSSYVERAIYDGFVPNSDWNIARQFHAADWPRKAGLIHHFSDLRLRRLASRLIYENAPHLLNSEKINSAETALMERLNGLGAEKVKPRTIKDAISEGKSLLKSGLYDRTQVTALVKFVEDRASTLLSTK